MLSFGSFLRLLILLVLCAATHVAAAATVLVLLSEPSPIYQEFANAVSSELRRDASGIEVIQMHSDQVGAKPLPEAQFVIGAGNRAAQILVNRDIKAPTLLALLPRSAYDRIAAGKRDDKRVSALFIDQPPARYIDLVRVALPDAERIGMLAGPDSRDTVARLMQVARDRKLRPMQENIASDSDIFPALQRMFGEGGVLMAVPDTAVFNSQTIPNLLLSAYRFRVPVVGFSQAYVKAGALIALYSTPEQIGTQSAEIARNVLAGGSVPAPQYPRLFNVGINTHVARSLGYQLDSETGIRDKLERLERP
ncbi:ABC transporter substrate-binding protein [Uliginosibacterium sp. sgz301328]|uniref:ABC transporter substrate-binding protein n=1 Tax=Uliginosibacterium sp. sgz301328 TaxID=3243764 RepID=UPI00359D21BD